MGYDFLGHQACRPSESDGRSGLNRRTPSGGEVQHLRGILVEFVVLEDMWCGQLGELGPNFDHLLVFGLLVEMLCIGFCVIMLVLRGVVMRVVVVVRHGVVRGTTAIESASEVLLRYMSVSINSPQFTATLYTFTVSSDNP